MTLTVPEVLGILALALATAKFLASRMDAIRVDNNAAHASITENVKALTEQVAALNNSQAALSSGQAELTSGQAALSSGQAALSSGQAELSSSQAALTSSQAALTENVRALTENGKVLAENINENRRQIASLGTRLGAIAVDVAFLRGRQEERDRADRAAAGGGNGSPAERRRV